MIKVKKIWLTDNAIYIETEDGRVGHENFADYARLRNATAIQREQYVASPEGLHWPELDEDLSFECFFDKKDKSSLYLIFDAHPELNVSAVARRLGMKQSLLAAYISGAKNPSYARMAEIVDAIRQIGLELSDVEIPKYGSGNQ